MTYQSEGFFALRDFRFKAARTFLVLVQTPNTAIATMTVRAAAKSTIMNIAASNATLFLS